MPLVDETELKKRYSKLDNKDKEVIGSALIKVNMGIVLPADLRRAAAFLKGSPYIAAKGKLDDVIYLLYHDIESLKESADSKLAIHTDATPGLDETELKSLDDCDEDSEVTAKEHVDKIK